MGGTQKIFKFSPSHPKDERIHKGSCPLQQGGLAPNPYKTCECMSKTKINITYLPNISLSPLSTMQLFHHNGNLTRWSFFIKYSKTRVKVSSELILQFVLHEWLIEDEKTISNEYICWASQSRWQKNVFSSII